MAGSKKNKSNQQKDRFIRAPQSYETSPVQSGHGNAFLTDGDGTKVEVESPQIRLKRSISKSPIAVLEVANMSADFYLNLMDWKRSLLGISIGNGLYFYDIVSKRIEPWAQRGTIEGMDDNGTHITSFQFDKQQDFIYIGTSKGVLKMLPTDHEPTELLDVPLLSGFRIAVLDARPDGLVGCGNKFGQLSLVKPTSQHKVLTEIQAHDMEICGLKWHPTNDSVLATGGNDNSVRVWDIRRLSEPVYRNDDFKGAVRAMDWCPWNPDILCVGGGSSDRTLRTLKYRENTTEAIIDTGSQICAAYFYPAYHEIITAHGFIANDIGIWKHPGLQCIDHISSFNNRILQSAMNVDMGLLAAGCPGDRLVKIWSLESKVTAEFEEGKRLR